MELLYIWIEEYKNIIKQGFNFSPKHYFEFIPEFEDNKPENEIIGGELIHKEKDYNLPDDFFGDNIVNVTGIVGKNGCGKTSLLNFIPIWIKIDTIKQIVIFKEGNNIVIYHSKNLEIPSNFKKIAFTTDENCKKFEVACKYKKLSYKDWQYTIIGTILVFYLPDLFLDVHFY